MSLRVVVADSHPPTRKGLQQALESADMTVVAAVGSADAAIESIQIEKPDLCVLDVQLKGGGIATARAIHEQLPQTAIVMLSATDAEEDVFAALRAGASGFLLKSMSPERIPMALQGVLGGEAALPRSLVMKLIKEFRSAERRRRIPAARGCQQSLTGREWEVLELLRQRLTTQEIAQKLSISSVTVRRHLSSLARKIRVATRAEIIEIVEQLDR